MVANMSDEDIWRLNRGGHDPHKVYAAYAAAVKHKGQPTVILAKTVKGYGMGAAGEGKNIAHQQKKMRAEALKQFRDRFNIPIADDKLAEHALSPPGRELARDEVPARASRGTGRVPAAAPAQEPQRSRRRSWRRSSRCSRRPPRAARSPPRWPSCACWPMLVKDKNIGKQRRAHRARRVAHLRHGGAVPPARHLLVGRPALRAGGRRPADVLQGGQERPDPPGRHQRGRARCARGSRRRRRTPTTACR